MGVPVYTGAFITPEGGDDDNVNIKENGFGKEE